MQTQLPAASVPRWVCAELCSSLPRGVQKDARRGAGPSTEPVRPVRSACSCSAYPLPAMTSLSTMPSLGELTTITPILEVTGAVSPEAEASTALIAVVITVVFLTLLSVVILIFFYLYKNKGSYITYEPAEEPSTILHMESDSAKDREKEEYFI
ncbi:small cell adhesion glycoprotein [Rhynchonycteris naso]